MTFTVAVTVLADGDDRALRAQVRQTRSTCIDAKTTGKALEYFCKSNKLVQREAVDDRPMVLRYYPTVHLTNVGSPREKLVHRLEALTGLALATPVH